MTCIDLDSLLKLELGELGEGETSRVEQHLSSCPHCQKRRAAQGQMIDDLGVHAGESDDVDAFVLRVMSACDDGAQVEPRSPWFRTYLPAALAATALAFVVVSSFFGPAIDIAERGLTPRGVGSFEAPAIRVEAFVGRAGPNGNPALLDGAELRPGDGIVVRYSNAADRDAFLMVFALDAAREVHWLHPAYLRRGENPQSIRLARRAERVVLDEVAEPDRPAPGPLRVYALVTDSPLDVEQVESELANGEAPVAERFPTAALDEWRCTWRSR